MQGHQLLPEPPSNDSPHQQTPAGTHTFAAWCRGGVPALLDGPRGSRVQVAPRHEVKQLVAHTLHGQAWDEVALDIILQKIDLNTGPPMVDSLTLRCSRPRLSNDTTEASTSFVAVRFVGAVLYGCGKEIRHAACTISHSNEARLGAPRRERCPRAKGAPTWTVLRA